MGVFLVPFTQRASTMLLPFLYEALLQNLNFVMAQGCFGAVLGSIRLALRGVLGPLRSSILYHAASFLFRGFDTNFESSNRRFKIFR